jgi:hypothetical protein
MINFFKYLHPFNKIIHDSELNIFNTRKDYIKYLLDKFPDNELDIYAKTLAFYIQSEHEDKGLKHLKLFIKKSSKNNEVWLDLSKF